MADLSGKTKISLKILVDKEKERVVFAEADYSFVDILFSFMTMPMGTIVRLLEKQSDPKIEALGSLNSLYKGLANLPATCFQSEECKAQLLNPGNPSEDQCKKLRLNLDDSGPTRFFTCNNYNTQRDCSTYKGIRCSCFSSLMTEKTGVVSAVTSNSTKSEFVMETTSFLVTDSLHVMPNSPSSCIRLANDLGVADIRHLEERTVDIGLEEIQNLLKFSLVCKSSLTYLLLPKRNASKDLLSRGKGKLEEPVIGKETASNSRKMNLKLILQKSTSKLLFAEADEEFVDFLISFLTIPLGTLIGKLNGSAMGSIDNLYTSISNLSAGRFIRAQDIKDMLIQRHLIPMRISASLMFKLQDPIVQRGFVKGPSTFMVTDDLVITALSSNSSFNILTSLQVPFGDFEEVEVRIGMEEGLRILKASLKSSSALTNGLQLPLKSQSRKFDVKLI